MVTGQISSFITSVRDTLQDQQATRWTDEELTRYIDQGNRDMAYTTKYMRVPETISVVDGTTTYDLTYEAIEFHEIDSTQKYEVLNNKQIEFEDSTAEDVDIVYYAYPDRIQYGVTTSLTLENDLFDALRFFVLYRAYQKEASTTNMQKAQYFKNEYENVLKKNMPRWHGQEPITLYRSDYLTV